MEKTEGGKPGFVLSLQAHLNTVFAASLNDAKLQAGVRTFHSAVINSTPSLFFTFFLSFFSFFLIPSTEFLALFLRLQCSSQCNGIYVVEGSVTESSGGAYPNIDRLKYRYICFSNGEK